jgi:hypothetical protein
VRFTLVGAGGAGSRRAAAEAYRHLLGVVLEITELLESGSPEDSPDAYPPGNLDVAVYPWTGRKRFRDGATPGATLGKDECNSGVTFRYDGGGVSVLVYRKEEAVKVLIHELLHAYGVGEWAGRDAKVSEHLRGSCGVPLDRIGPLKTTEVVVECFAVCLAAARVSRLTGEPLSGIIGRCSAFGARQGRAVLDILCGGARQETAAYQYHYLKAHVLRRLASDGDSARALAEDGRIPSRESTRGYLLSVPAHGNSPSRTAAARGAPPGAEGAVLSLRMIPRSAEEPVPGLAPASSSRDETVAP